jgi:hypothetical protein
VSRSEHVQELVLIRRPLRDVIRTGIDCVELPLGSALGEQGRDEELRKPWKCAEGSQSRYPSVTECCASLSGYDVHVESLLQVGMSDVEEIIGGLWHHRDNC